MSDEKETKPEAESTEPKAEASGEATPAPEAASQKEAAAKEAPPAAEKAAEGAEKKDAKADGEAAGKKDEKPARPARPPEPSRVRGRPSQARGAGGPGGGRGGPGGGRGGGRGGRGGGPGGGRNRRDRDADQPTEAPLEERVLKINRCATVVKGGRRFSFSALVIVGDKKGRVGVGFGKANEVPPTVEKAVKDARKNFFQVPIANGTIPHEVVGVYRGSRVVLLPAQPGTGIIAGAVVRALAECSGIQNILTKSFGSNNPINLAKAAASALQQLRSREEVMRLRGVTS